MPAVVRPALGDRAADSQAAPLPLPALDRPEVVERGADRAQESLGGDRLVQEGLEAGEMVLVSDCP